MNLAVTNEHGHYLLTVSDFDQHRPIDRLYLLILLDVMFWTLIKSNDFPFFLIPQEHPWILKYEHEPVDIAGWVCSTMNLPPSTPN